MFLDVANILSNCTTSIGTACNKLLSGEKNDTISKCKAACDSFR